MPRYYDIDKLKEMLEAKADTLIEGKEAFHYVAKWLELLPPSDAVEVVRCRDCRYFTKGMAIGMCKRIEDKPIIPCCCDNFCKYGDRRE